MCTRALLASSNLASGISSTYGVFYPKLAILWCCKNLKRTPWTRCGVAGGWPLMHVQDDASLSLCVGKGVTAFTTQGRTMKKLVVFDFDHTLIDCNSDTWVVKKLGAWELMKTLQKSLPWNTLMDRMMVELHSSGRSLLDIQGCLETCPLHPSMLQAVKLAASLGCELQIVSDANTWFIDIILQAYGIRHLFTEIHTNPAYVDADGVLRILPFHSFDDVPHKCQLCPPNMCKGMILDRIFSRSQAREQVIYLGDGKGDFCPSLRLDAWDHVLARSGFPLARLLEGCAAVKCEVHHWDSAENAVILLTKLLTSTVSEQDGSAAKRC